MNVKNHSCNGYNWIFSPQNCKYYRICIMLPKKQSVIIQIDIWTFLLYHCIQTLIKEYHTTLTTHIKTLVYMYVFEVIIYLAR